MEPICCHLLLLLLLSHLSLTQSSCDTTDRDLLFRAFHSVSGFQLSDQLLPTAVDDRNCPKIEEIRLPSRNLTGTVSWMFLRNISSLHTLDLSKNSLQGSVPGRFWSAPSLLEVNLASNRLGGTIRFEPDSTGPHPRPPSLRALNLSGNRFTNAVGLSEFKSLQVLDVSHNSMAGAFPRDFPPFESLRFLNLSYNNFTGKVDSKHIKKFGRSAFVNAGSLNFVSSAHGPVPHTSSSTHKKGHKRRNRAWVIGLGISGAVCVVLGLGLLCGVLFLRRRRRKGWVGKWKEEMKGVSASQEAGWVAEARWAAPVVVFEKPLMELTFSDLAAATSGFGRESQLAEGRRSGPVYRAVLPGDMHVVVRVLESATDVEEREAATVFQELARLRHPNLLPLLGYCIAGREKLVLYEYMEKGDLHRWLHELPAGQPDVEDWTSDTWEHQGEDKRSTAAASGGWPTRHRIALGIARGLAFLHQGWGSKAFVHGHLVPSNVLLGEDLEPRIADFAACGSGTVEGDVYSYGVVLMELVTGKEGWSEETVGWARGLVRSGRSVEAVDPMLRVEGGGRLEWEREMVDGLRVGYLCTADSPGKRPTMQQVVGLLKDIRPASSSSSA